MTSNWSSDILLPNFHLHVKWSEDSHVSFRFFPGMILQSTTPFFPEKKEEFFVISHGTRTMAIVRLDEKSCFFCVLTSFWWSKDEKRFEIFSWNCNLKPNYKFWFDFTKFFTMMFDIERLFVSWISEIVKLEGKKNGFDNHHNSEEFVSNNLAVAILISKKYGSLATMCEDICRHTFALGNFFHLSKDVVQLEYVHLLNVISVNNFQPHLMTMKFQIYFYLFGKIIIYQAMYITRKFEIVHSLHRDWVGKTVYLTKKRSNYSLTLVEIGKLQLFWCKSWAFLILKILRTVT